MTALRETGAAIETAVDEPNTLDLTRQPNRHVAFGHRIHSCLGALLARLDGQIAILTSSSSIDDTDCTEIKKRPGCPLDQTVRSEALVRRLRGRVNIEGAAQAAPRPFAFASALETSRSRR